ncbi:MAG: glycosyltransferase family 2 protein [Planctomycetota bacterium]|jgi:cellulose synthase/poly-beta-1,6-N-acetylglucosamine synthase-like glycosyltransferase
MDWHDYIAWAAIVSQLVFLVQCYRNYLYALSKYKKQRLSYRPRTALLIPCKGLDAAFDENITSFFRQDYEGYVLWFVVAEKSDPAYERLCELKERLSNDSKAQEVRILIAGQGKFCSQKIHNLLYCCERISGDIEVLAFADSDASVRPDWLSHLVWPLHQSKNGAASGYRWFIPQQNNPASLALSAVNGKIAQLLGNSRLNLAWGGSMAIRVDVFREVGLDNIWPKALSDDLSLSYAVRKAGKKITFVPACLVASYESMTWRQLFEFGRRQFLITRVSAAATWWFGLLSSLYSIAGLWGGAAWAIHAATIGAKNVGLYAAVPIVFLVGQYIRAILRQAMVSKLLAEDVPRMKSAMLADLLACWMWSLLLLALILSSALGRTITWRGIRYKLLGPTETVVIGGK